ncbi:MAG: hypothetical protein OEY50_12250, partial [Nitrospinota bacterium]|nr:hypothetical protein [Nitrospinota bacterium]
MQSTPDTGALGTTFAVPSVWIRAAKSVHNIPGFPDKVTLTPVNQLREDTFIRGLNVFENIRNDGLDAAGNKLTSGFILDQPISKLVILLMSMAASEPVRPGPCIAICLKGIP